MKEIQSDNYIENQQGWKISADGNAEFYNGKFRGTVVIGNTIILDPTGGWGNGAIIFNNKGYFAWIDNQTGFGASIEGYPYCQLLVKADGSTFMSGGNCQYSSIYVKKDGEISIGNGNYSYAQIGTKINYVGFSPAGESDYIFFINKDGSNYFLSPGVNNAYYLGASNLRFKDGFFVSLHVQNGVTVGDLIFKNGWRIIEEDDNLIFVNNKNEKVLKISSDGIEKLDKKETIKITKEDEGLIKMNINDKKIKNNDMISNKK